MKKFVEILLLFLALLAKNASSQQEFFLSFTQEIHSVQNFITYSYIKLSQHQISQHLVLSFMPQNPLSNSPKFTVEMGIIDNNYTKTCENPTISNKKLCVIFLPKKIISLGFWKVFIKITCLSEKCDLLIRPLIIMKTEIIEGEPKFNYIKNNMNCQLFGFPGQNTTNDRIVFSMQSHNTEAYSLYQKTDLFQFFSLDSGNRNVGASFFYLTERIVVVFNKTFIDSCENECEIFFLFCSESELLMEILVRSYATEVPDICPNSSYIDYIEPNNKLHFYHLPLDEAHSVKTTGANLIFQLKSLTGSSKTLYINPDYKVRKLKDYQYNSTLEEFYREEDIIISSEDLVLADYKGKEFYMAVESNYSGLFMLEIKEDDTLINSINVGVAETRAIKAEELHYYNLLLWNSRNQDGYLTVKAIVDSGNIEIYIRQCSSNQECPKITKEDIEKLNNIDYISENSKIGNKKIRVPSKCKDDNDPRCNLLIAIKGFNGTFLGINRYSLLINRENTTIALLENQRHDSHIDLGERMRFRLDVTDPDATSTRIKFIISADLPIFSTQDNKCFEVSCAEKAGNTRDPIIYFITNSTTQTTYFLFVEGVKSADFSLYAEVIRSETPASFIPLSEGKSFSGIIDKNQDLVSFSFLIEKEEEIDIEVILQGPKNSLVMEVYNGLEGGFGWIPNEGNILEIKHLKTNNKLYRVYVYAEIDIDLSTNILHFSIMYATGKTLRVLEKNKLFYETLKPNTTKHYIFYVDTQEGTIVISKHIINPVKIAYNIEVFISDFPYPENKFYIHDLEKAETSRINLKTDDLNLLCANSNSHHCPIYLSVYNSHENLEATLSLLVHFKNKPIQLFEGYEQRFLLEHKEEVIRGFFIPSSNSTSLDLFFYTEDEKFEVFASIFDDKEKKAVSYQYFLDFPNKTSYNFYSHENSQHNLIFKPKNFEFCWPSCVILFTITYSLQYHEYASLSVLISSNYTELYEGKQLVFSLGKQQIKYFYYNLEEFLKNDENDEESWVSLSLTPYYGSAFININLVHKMRPVSPTPQNSDFFVYENHFSITKESIISKLRNFVTNTSILYEEARLEICFYSEDDGKFMINILKSTHLLQNLFVGTPLEIFIKSQKDRYFQFYLGFEDSFKLIFNRESGNALVKIMACNDSIVEDVKVFENCKTKKGVDIKIIAGSGSGYLQVSKETLPDFCKKCYYLIHITTTIGDLKGTLIVKEREQYNLVLQEGHKFYDHLAKEEETRFIFWTSAYEITELSATVFLGNPIIYFSPQYSANKEYFLVNFTKENSNLIKFFIPPKNVYQKDHKDVDILEWGSYSANYLLVYASEISEYSLSYVTKGSQILQGGLVHQDTIRAKESKSFVYQKIDDNSGYLTINFDQLVGNLTENINVEFLFRHSSLNEGGFEAKEMGKIDLVKTYESRRSVCWVLPNDKFGTYLINLSSKIGNVTEAPKKFSIVVNSRDISMIPYNYTLRSFMKSRNMNFYESFAPRAGFLVLDLLQCFGNLELFMTKDYHKFLLEDFDEDFKPSTGHSFVHIMKLDESSMVYFCLKSGEINSIFDLSLRFYESYSEIPHVKFSIEETAFQYSIDSENNEETKFSFKGLMCESCPEKEKKNTFVEYYIIVSSSMSHLLKSGECEVFEMDNEESKSSALFNQLVGEYSLIDSQNVLTQKVKLQRDIHHYVLIKAIVKLGTKELYPIFYPVIEVYTSSQNSFSTIFNLIMIIAIIVGLIFCIVAVFFFRRYRAAMKKLKYEMEDVRNIAQVSAVNTSIEMENKKYQGLADDLN